MRIEEIALRARVSKSAVSLALNGKPGVSDETRERILTIAREVGYVPKSMQRAEQLYGSPKVFRFVACTNFGIVSDEYQNQPFFTELFHHIEDQCRQHGYSVLYSSIRHDKFVEEIDRLENSYVTKGIILLGTNLDAAEIEKVTTQNTNIVIIDTLFEASHHTFVVMNNLMGAYQAADYLIELGHRDIGYVQSSSRMYNFDTRRKGFFGCVTAHGLSIPERYTFTLDPTTTTAQPGFIAQWSNLGGTKPTALFCECDYAAISVIKSFADMGVRVPQDVSIVGFDNIRESTIIQPELTTINVAKQAMAIHAVRALISAVENSATEQIKVIVDTSLVERNSCCPPVR